MRSPTLRVLCCLHVLAVVACDSPTSPSAAARIPNVAGTYTGSLTFSILSTGDSLPIRGRITATQAGSQVTLTGSLTLSGQTLELPAVTGTVSATGFFTATGGGFYEDAARDPTCGRITTTSSTLVFSVSGQSASSLRYQETATTDYCGNLQISGTLYRQ